MPVRMMALPLWLGLIGLKWTDNLDRPRGNRWLVLISFLVELTFGIQFMGFLAIQSIGLLNYFRPIHGTQSSNSSLVFISISLAPLAVLSIRLAFQ